MGQVAIEDIANADKLRPKADRLVGLAQWLAAHSSVLFATLAGLSGVLLTFVVLPPPMYADSHWIWRTAEMWPNIPRDFPVLHQAMRLGIVLPTRFAQIVLGHDQSAWVAASSVLAALFTAGTYLVGRALFGNVVGLVAVGLLIVHPFFTVVDPYTAAVADSTGGLLPDMPAAGVFSAAVAALVVASRRQGREELVWLATAGTCFGVAYLMREYVAFMFVAIPVFFLLLRIPQRRLVVPAVPMLAIFGFEMVHNQIVYGDPIARLTIASEHEAPLPQPLSMTDVLLRFGEAMNSHPLGLAFVLALALTVISAIVTRDRRFMLLVAWFVSLWVPFTVLGGLLDPAEPSLRTHLVRYWFLVFPPLVVGAVATIQLLIDRLSSTQTRRDLALVSITAVAAIAYVAPALDAPALHRDSDWRQLRTWLAQHQEIEIIYTDSRTGQTAPFYAMTAYGEILWDGEFRTFRRQAPALPVDDIGNRPYLQSRFGAREEPDPADGWRVLWRSSNDVLTIWQRQ